LAQNAQSIRGLVTWTGSTVDAELINKLPKLEIVSAFSVGVDKVRFPVR
jgi:hydroxypyruvate reductase 2